MINRGDYHYARNVVGSPDFIVYDDHLDRAYRIEMKVVYDDRDINRDSIRDCLSDSQLSWWDRKQYDDDSDYCFVLVYVKRERKFYLINYRGLDDESYPIYTTNSLLKVFHFLKKYHPLEFSRRESRREEFISKEFSGGKSSREEFISKEFSSGESSRKELSREESSHKAPSHRTSSHREEPEGCFVFLILACVIVFLCVFAVWYFG